MVPSCYKGHRPDPSFCSLILRVWALSSRSVLLGGCPCLPLHLYSHQEEEKGQKAAASNVFPCKKLPSETPLSNVHLFFIGQNCTWSLPATGRLGKVGSGCTHCCTCKFRWCTDSKEKDEWGYYVGNWKCLLKTYIVCFNHHHLLRKLCLTFTWATLSTDLLTPPWDVTRLIYLLLGPGLRVLSTAKSKGVLNQLLEPTLPFFR